MTYAKNNQLINKLSNSFKSDELTLINTCNTLQQIYPDWEIHKEPYLLFDDNNQLYAMQESIMEIEKRHFRNPDIVMVHPNKRLIIIELDGFIHVKKTTKTWERNELYEKAGLQYIVVNEEDLKFQKIEPMVYITDKVNELI